MRKLLQTAQYLLVSLLVIAWANPSHANGSRAEAESWLISSNQFVTPEIQQGIPRNYILDIAQDEHGFIWFASSFGLIRFDGYKYKVFAHDPDVDNSLPHDFVRELYLDKKNHLWVATINGFAKFDREKEAFESAEYELLEDSTTDIWSISQTTEGEMVLASSDQLYRFDTESKNLQLYNEAIEFPTNIKRLLDQSTRLWIGTFGNGAYIYNKSTRQLHSLSSPNPWGINLDINELHDIKIINGYYWLATDKGLYQLTENEQFNIVNHYFEQESIRNIGQSGNTIVVSSTSDVFEIKSKDYTGNYQITGQSKVSNTDILSLFVDKHSVQWLGTADGFLYKPEEAAILPLIGKRSANNYEGLSKSDRLARDIWGLSEDQNGNIWSISQSGEIERYNPSTNKIKEFDTGLDIEGWDLVIDSKERLWVATGNGVRVFKVSGTSLTEVARYFDNTPIYNLYHRAGLVWIWSTGKQLISIDVAKDDNQTIHNFDQTFTDANIAFQDEQSRLWIASRERSSIYHPGQRQLIDTPDFFNDLRTSLLHVYLSDNFYWLVTYNKGLYKIDSMQLEVVDYINLAQSVGGVFSAEGHEKELWLNNGSSIFSFDLPSKTLTEQIKPNQLADNSLYQISARTAEGQILFGGKYGYHIVEPDSLNQRAITVTKSASPIVSGLRLNASPISFKDKLSPHDKPLYLSDAVTIPYSDRRFGFDFVSVNPKSPEVVQYRYKLADYDEQWTPAENALSRIASYHNIPWGSYTFLVQAKETNSSWSDARQLRVNIEAPPWFSIPALVSYAVIASILILVLGKQYHSRKRAQEAIRSSEQRLKLTLWSSGDELWDWDIIKNRVHRSNIWGTVDFPQDGLRTAEDGHQNIHPHDLPRVQLALSEHLNNESEHYELSYRLRTNSHQWIWVLDRGKVVQRDNNDQALRMTGTLRNIQHLKNSEEQLRLFERSVQTISEAVFITDLNFKFISVNKAYCSMTGESSAQALVSYLYFHQYPSAFTEEIRKSLEQKGNWSGEIESRRVNGERYEMEINIDAIYGDTGQVTHFVGVFSDISERKSTEKELLKLANSDPLTDLPNRSFFQASQQNLVRKSQPYALLCFDMDNFKKVNDSLGHQTGDLLIKQVAKRLQKIIGSSATCYRLGGDEFAILVENSIDVHAVTHLAQSILDSLVKPFMISNQELVLTASVGIAFYPEDGNTPQEMLKNADTAMYFAKNVGGDTYKFFSSEMNTNAVRQLQIENLIRQGIKEDLFSVFYQPKVDINSGQLVSMEALVRFEHPSKGIVSPVQFIPLAEQSGQIIDIGEVVLEKALMDTKRWVESGTFAGRVAVNLSAKQFELPDLDNRIETILKRVGISALHLECEITEGTLMENPEQALMMMQRLRDKGIHLALDDFGTGYSSLAYLKRFPLNTLKIDKAFIDDIATSNVDRHMAAAIINIAHNLGLKVVAEGVEHEDQLDILRRYDCELLQGYLYSKPLRADKFEALLTENRELNQFLNQVSFTE